MDLQPWHIWIILGIFAFIVEIFTPSFIAGSVGIGLIGGGIAAALNASTEIQLLVFSLAVLVSFFAIRPMLLRYEKRKRQDKMVKTNAESMVGKTGTVSETIDPNTNSGRVSIDGDSWQARSEDGNAIEKGVKVEVTKLDSIIITVKKV